MKNIYSCFVAIFLMGMVFLPLDKVTAGNKDRSGQADGNPAKNSGGM